jgi:triosephosphate isomerase
MRVMPTVPTRARGRAARAARGAGGGRIHATTTTTTAMAMAMAMGGRYGRQTHEGRRRGSTIVREVGTGRFIVGGNWKCNGTRESVATLLRELKSGDVGKLVDVVVAPPFLFIDEAMKELGSPFEVAAQNCWVEPGLVDPTHHYDSDTGAFTGEVSAEMLEDLGVPWVILGHSERRAAPHNESNEFVGKKVAHARFHGLSVIVCVGESLEERESGKTMAVIFDQLQAVADEIDDKEHSSWGSNVVIAYEPIWAIGTGKVATPDQVQQVHASIRKWLENNVSEEVSKATRIQYGGSVNADNCEQLAKLSDIDGFLVGGASLKGMDFVKICNTSAVHYKAVGLKPVAR